MLTAAQKTALKTFIAGQPSMASQPANSDGDFEIARQLNLTASPAFTVWKTNVSIKEVGDKLNGTELAGLSSLNNTRLQTVAIFSEDGVNPSIPDRRQFFDDIFSGAGGTNTRASLLALWKRAATVVEKLFATGTGSDASPATLTWEGQISYQDVGEARNS